MHDVCATLWDEAFNSELAEFSLDGSRTLTERRRGIPFFYNEFWTARQRQAARIHEISYRACFKPQLPGFFIERLTRPGEAVYDPFMGRGTTPIQAALMGRRPMGSDINPLSLMLARPRLRPPALPAIEERLQRIDWHFNGESQDDLLVFYHPETLRELNALKRWFERREKAGLFDETDDWVRMVALNRLSGHSPGFFSVYTLPPNQAVTVEAQRKINDRRAQAPPRRSVPAIILKKSRALLSGAPAARLHRDDFLLCTAPGANAPQIPTGAVSLVVTSPPFLDVVDYARDNWLRCWFAGIDPAEVSIAACKKLEEWERFVRSTFRELARVVRKGGCVAFEVGEVKHGSVKLEETVLDVLGGLPFTPLCVVVNRQHFTKTSNCWGIDNNRKGTNTNRIVVCRRA